MKVALIFLLGFILSIDPNKVGKINSLKAEAKKAFLAGDFKTAIAKYRYLKDSLGVTEEEVGMNLASAYFRTNDTTAAFSAYQPLTVSKDSKIKSLANQQMGVLASRQSKFDEALNYFKQALKAEPANDQARFNYEMLKKKLEQKKKEEQQKNDEQNNKNIEPSEFAKKMKAEADRLVSKREYLAAHDLMAQALQKDKTVAHYQEFINRTKSVAGIK